MGRDSVVGITLCALWSEVRTPAGARFSALVQTSPDAYPTTCTTSTAAISRG